MTTVAGIISYLDGTAHERGDATCGQPDRRPMQNGHVCRLHELADDVILWRAETARGLYHCGWRFFSRRGQEGEGADGINNVRDEMFEKCEDGRIP